MCRQWSVGTVMLVDLDHHQDFPSVRSGLNVLCFALMNLKFGWFFLPLVCFMLNTRFFCFVSSFSVNAMDYKIFEFWVCFIISSHINGRSLVHLYFQWLEFFFYYICFLLLAKLICFLRQNPSRNLQKRVRAFALQTQSERNFDLNK